jgi:ABC-type nitrate/sulfonate/bicarbonate transport system substrate-binding protein
MGKESELTGGDEDAAGLQFGRRHFLRSTGAGALVVGLGLPALITACGDDDDSGESTGTTGSGSTASFGNAAIQFSWIKNVEFAGSYIADTNGFYTEAGFDSVELLSGGPNVSTEPIVATGKALVGYTFHEPFANAVSNEDAPLKVIGAMFQKNPFCILSTSENPINKPEDMYGKKIGVQATNETIWNAFIEVNDLDASKIEQVPVQFDPTPLVNGEVDGWFAFLINEPITIEEQGATAVTMALGDFGLNILQQLLVTTNDAFENDKDKLAALLRAELRGWQVNAKDPAVGAKLAVDNYGKDLGLDLEHETRENEEQIKLQSSATTDDKGLGYMSDEQIASNIELLSQMGFTVTADHYSNEILDMVYADGIDLT